MSLANILPAIVFYFFAAVLLFSAVMVVLSAHPVKGVLFLVLGFFASTILWMLLQAEFLALVLIFVYVGAVMTLFLFVVMMLNIDIAVHGMRLVRYIPLALAVIAVFTFMLLQAVNPTFFATGPYHFVSQPAGYSNVKQLGGILYTQYALPFELAAVLLLISIIAAISLVFRGSRPRKKVQNIASQIAVRPKDRIQLIK
jgi:NADH-quinone oxidoreductase subunit J